MNQSITQWLTRSGAARQLDLTAYQFDRLVGRGRLNQYPQPGLLHPRYKQDEVSKLKAELVGEMKGSGQ